MLFRHCSVRQVSICTWLECNGLKWCKFVKQLVSSVEDLAYNCIIQSYALFYYLNNSTKFLLSYFFVHFYYCWSINWYNICKLLKKIGFRFSISSKHLETALSSLLHLNHFVCCFKFLFIKWMVVVVFSLVKRWKIAVMPEYRLCNLYAVSKSPYLVIIMIGICGSYILSGKTYISYFLQKVLLPYVNFLYE